MIETEKLMHPEDDFVSAFPGLGFQNRFCVQTTGEPIVVCDPTYIADVYNSEDEVAASVRKNGAFLMDFGGDSSCPVFWKSPYVLFPLSMHLSDDERDAPLDAKVWAEVIGTDSGSFVFLPYSDALLPEVKVSILNLIEEGNAALLPAPPGTWTLMYEQFEPPQDNMIALYRNIVLRREQDP